MLPKIKSITLISVILSLICLCLSIWQFKRLTWKENLIINIEKAYNSNSLNINLLTGDLSNFKFNKVDLVGFFTNQKSMFLGPRVNKDKVGYNLITPFFIKDGRYILVNRGWVKDKKKIKEDKTEYKLIGILKQANIKNIFTPENSLGENLWFYINTNEMSEYSDLNLIDNVFVDLIKIDPNNKVSIINSSIPKITNNHLQYAITWAILALLFLVMNYIYYKKKDEK